MCPPVVAETYVGVLKRTLNRLRLHGLDGEIAPDLRPSGWVIKDTVEYLAHNAGLIDGMVSETQCSPQRSIGWPCSRSPTC